jgi:DUF4097 and DUF4098 domain-containing protein YvlB
MSCKWKTMTVEAELHDNVCTKRRITMLNRWLIVAVICLPAVAVIADDDVSPVPPIPPVDDENIELIIIEGGSDDDRREIQNRIRIEVPEGDWGDFGESIGDFFNDIGQWIGDVGSNVGRSVGRSFRFPGGDSFVTAKAEAGNYSEIDETKSIRPGGTIEIDNIVGSVKVEGWNRDEIEITGRLGEDVERLLFDIDGNDERIKVIVPKGKKLRIKTELIIRIPKQTTLEIHTITAPIDVSNVRGGSHEFETVTGTITLDAVSGELNLHSINGRITVEGADSDVEVDTISGRISVDGKPRTIEAQSISGRITLNGVQRRVSIETISDRADVQADELSRLDSESISGSFNFEGGLSDDAEVDISSMSGSIRLTLGRLVNGCYSLRGRSGSKNVEFGNSAYSANRRKNLIFTTQKSGHADIRLESHSGSINITD